jgi:hypothetical protein
MAGSEPVKIDSFGFIWKSPEKSSLRRKILQKISVIMAANAGTGKSYSLMQGRRDNANDHNALLRVVVGLLFIPS